MSNLIDKSYFEALSLRDSKELCMLTECTYDDVKKIYAIAAWNDEYTIDLGEFEIGVKGKVTSELYELFYLFLIYYLVNVRKIEMENEWISEKDIPGGATFFRGPHEIPTNFISKLYKSNLKAFKERCVQLGGVELNLADVSYAFNIVTNIKIAVLYWDGDDDFSPEAKILYDKSIIKLLSPDIIFSLAVDVCNRIGRK